MNKLLIPILFLSLACITRAEDAKPLKVLMVTGGCCHDYEQQKLILAEGISARANVEFTIVHEEGPEGKKDKTHKISIYEKADWAKGYDVVLHNECFGAVDDVAFVERIAKAHFDGVPAVMLHCSAHSYRAAKTDEWRKCVGQKSMSHEKNRDLRVKNLKPEHPVMKGFPMEWLDKADELYKNEVLYRELRPAREGLWRGHEEGSPSRLGEHLRQSQGLRHHHGPQQLHHGATPSSSISSRAACSGPAASWTRTESRWRATGRSRSEHQILINHRGHGGTQRVPGCWISSVKPSVLCG